MKPILPNSTKLYKASIDGDDVPEEPGLYEIHIAEPKYLLSPFGDVLSERNQTLLYMGKAEGKKGIRQRLLDQDLRGKSNASFFRSIGVVLDHMDKVKRLKSPSRNFKFENSEEIVDWIKHHLWVGWQIIQDGTLIKENEKRMIIERRPILNISYNPENDSCHYRRLKELRGKCCALAHKRFLAGNS
jgi:hypothetical protein